MNSPTICFQASITSPSRRRSLKPSCCISFGSNSPGACQRSGRILFAGNPRHSAMTAARREAFMNERVLVFPPHVARQNIQLGAVFCNGAARDWNSAFTQDLDNFLVAQRRGAVLGLHQIEDRFLHARVAHRFAGRRLVTGREEILHLENALRRRHIFAGNGAAHSRLVRSEEHTSELQSQSNLVCRLLLEKKNKKKTTQQPIPQSSKQNKTKNSSTTIPLKTTITTTLPLTAKTATLNTA